MIKSNSDDLLIDLICSKNGLKAFPIFCPKIGGTALPICHMAFLILPLKIKSSGKVCIRAASLVVIILFNVGCIGNALCPGTSVLDGSLRLNLLYT